MKIKISNLGSIKETELELRPLTVIIGQNNSNKTYLAYCVYGILQQCLLSMDRLDQINNLNSLMGWSQLVNESIHQEIERHLFERLIAQSTNNELFLKKPKANVEAAFIETLTTVFNKNIYRFKRKISIFFQDHDKKLFANSNFSLLPETFNALFDNRIPILGIEGKPIEERIAQALIDRIINTVLPKPFLLPTERNALVLNYKTLNSQRSNGLEHRHSQFHDKIQKPDESVQIRYPQPVEDFLSFLKNSEINKNGKLIPTTPFQILADKIERDILDKNHIFYESTVLEENEIKVKGKEIKVKINDKLTIDLYNASSATKQLTPLLLYLRYRAKENDLLIIDEPEMNLHPKSQAKLLEIFCILVNLGVKVLITTHSPYLVDHLNRLVNAKTDYYQTIQKQASALDSKYLSAFLTLEQVNAYEMKNNQLHLLKY
ncbi:MAG: ATP-binding protein [Thiomargarita sp.]|nr:ATP-binding protein [Thiomargarita sp.]